MFEWLERPQARFPATGAAPSVPLVLGILEELGTGANLNTDAQVAALALDWGGTIHSNDADFGRFPAVRWGNPSV